MVEDRTWMINDARLFTWAKCEGRRKTIEKLNLGGGNFLVTLGLFSTLNFLSKVYYLLHDNAKLWTKEEVDLIKKELKSNARTKKAKPPFVGSPRKTERDCFIKFASDLEYPLFNGSKELPISEQKVLYDKIWNSFRNKLAHMAMPDGTATALDFGDMSYNDAVEILDINTDAAFVKQEDRYVVFPDLFARDIKEWVRWLNQKIHDPKKFNEQRVIATINWIKSV